MVETDVSPCEQSQPISRKRAATACQFCRLRKTRCDNARPNCGFCTMQKAKCVYDEEDLDVPSQAEVRPVQDAAHQDIINRLDGIMSILQAQSAYSSSRGSISVQDNVGSPTLNTHLPTSPGPVSHIPSGQGLSPGTSTACESFLKWPIFYETLSDKEKEIESFLFDCPSSIDADEPSAGNNLTRTSDISSPDRLHSNFPLLSRNFLLHIYPRNPILDANRLIETAETAMEHGVGWDSDSCLMLIACALAHLTVPWSTEGCITDDTGYEMAEDARPTNANVSAANILYTAAQMRIGLMKGSLTDIQCLFFASVYKKYCLRPMNAWLYVQQASTRLHAYLLGGRRSFRVGSEPFSNDFEERVFWSLFKAESELIPHLGLQPSGLDRLPQTTPFPKPPTHLSRLDYHHPEKERATEEERGWVFYLAEISIRRTIQDSVVLLYPGDFYWIENIQSILHRHEECKKQISLWYSHLPPCVRFKYAETPSNELSFYFQGRFNEWRELIYRPIPVEER